MLGRKKNKKSGYIELGQALITQSSISLSPPSVPSSNAAFSLINAMFAHQSSMKNTFFCKKPTTNHTEELANLFDHMTEDTLNEFQKEFKSFMNEKCSKQCHSLNYFLTRVANIVFFAGSALFLTQGLTEKDSQKLLYAIACVIAILVLVKPTINTNAIAKVVDEVNQLVFISTQVKKDMLNGFFYKGIKYENTYSLYQQFQGQSLYNICYALENEPQPPVHLTHKRSASI